MLATDVASIRLQKRSKIESLQIKALSLAQRCLRLHAQTLRNLAQTLQTLKHLAGRT